MAGGVTGVGVELQGRLSLVRALVRNLGFDVLHVGTAQGSQVGGIGRGANDRQETGGSLTSRDEVDQGDKGQGESRLVEEHGETEGLTRVGTTEMDRTANLVEKC